MQKLEIEAMVPKTPTDHEQVHIALDFDGTLASYDSWSRQGNNIGKPILPMVKKVREWLSKGYLVSIFTARTSQPDAAQSVALIQEFLRENGLPDLPITCMKMHYFTHYVDDKAYHAIRNTGHIHTPMDFSLK